MKILIKLLGIKKGEFGRVSLLFIYNLLLILMFRMGRIINDTLIVSRLGADKLSFSYLGTSITLAFLLFIYFRVVDSFRRIKLLSFTAGIFCISLLLSRWLLRFHFWWFYQFLYIWIEAFGTIMILQFYTLASDIFGTRDAKRLFGIIGTGGVIGSIISGTVVRNLSKSLGTENFFFIVAGAVFICLIIINIIPKIFDTPRLLPKPRPHFQYSILKSRHVRYISLATGFVALVGAIVDYQFNNFLGDAYKGRENFLLGFYGNFYMILGIVSFLFNIFLTGRILLYFGLIYGLLLLPCSMLLGTLAIFFGIYKFPFIANRGCDFTFGYTIDSTSRHISILPISAEIRGRVKAFIDGIVRYIFQGAGALILLLTVRKLGISYINLSYILIVFLLMWIYCAIKLKKEYINSLISGIREKRIDLQEIELKITDHQTIKLLEKSLKEDDPVKVIYALSMLEEIPSFNLDINLLNHKSPLVRIHVLKRINDLTLIQSAFSDPSPEVVSEAILSYCRLLKKNAISRIKPFLESVNLDIRSGAIFGLIKYADYPLDPLINLFNTNKTDAMEIIAKLKLREFSGKIISCLGTKGMKATAFYALKEIGEEICPELEAYLFNPATDESIRIIIPSILAEIGTEKSTAVLVKHITIPDEKIRDIIIKALHTTGRHFDTIDCINIELENYYNTLYTIQNISFAPEALRQRRDRSWRGEGDYPATKIQEYILKDKLLQYRDRIHRLLEISYPVKLITNIKKIKTDSTEALDNLLKGELKNLILPIIEDSASLEKAGKYFKLKIISPASARMGETKEADMFSLVEEVLFLKGVSLFSQLLTEEIAKIAKITEEKTCDRGITIFNEGDPSDSLYIIMRGKINIIQGEKLIKTLKEGDYFGEIGMLDKGPRTAKAAVLEDAVLSRLGSEEFYELLSDNPQIAHGIFKILTEKLRESYETT